jgi:hypothetical protein
VIRIAILPDDVLLEIFHFYMNMYSSNIGKPGIEAWQLLVHVCRRWRVLVFQSPRRLNLQLYCTPQTPVKDTLDIWPALPLIVAGNMALSSGTDNILATLGQSNRVCQVELHLTGWQLEEILAVMQVPFPDLTVMELSSHDENPPVIPHSFLDGSASRLQNFSLFGIPFPGLPKLLMSATRLVHLHLSDIPHSGYVSPEAMVALLSVLSNLETLTLEFQSPQSRPDWETRRPPPSKRSVIPALIYFRFQGVTEYLEELVTRVDAPQLDGMDITFFNRIDFDCPRLAQFINHTPTLGARDEAHVQFNDSTVGVTLRYQTSQSGSDDLLIKILCREPDWQLSSIEQVSNSGLHRISRVEDLYIEHEYSQLVWNNDAIENTLWFELLLPFTAVENLYLSKEFAPGIVEALQVLVGGRTTEVLPSLQNIFFVEGLELSGPFQKNIEQFVASRQLSGLPIAISVWNTY